MTAPPAIRVGLDVTAMITGSTGIARYAANIDQALRDRGIQVEPFAIGRGSGRLPVGTRHLKLPRRVVEGTWKVRVPITAELLTRGPIDLVHSLEMLPPPSRAPLVATVHDVAAIEFPELHPPRVREMVKRRLDSLHRAAAVLAISTATAHGLARVGFTDVPVHVVHLGPQPLEPAPASESPVAGPFVLAVGELTLRKDYATMFAGFARADVGDHRLVVVGPDGYGSDQIRAAAAAAGLGDRLVLTGRVGNRELSALYSAATALCMSSVDEGFGIPLVEAMQRELPLIGSDIEVIHEVAADAAVYAPVGDPDGFAAAITSVIADDQLRSRLVVAGRRQAAQFTWERTAEKTIAGYRSVLGV